MGEVSVIRHWRSTPAPVALAGVFGLIVAASLALPAPAQALPIIGGPSLNPADWAVDGFKAILQFVFGTSLDDLGKQLVNLLLAVPLLSDHAAFPRLNAYRAYVTYGAWGLLSLTFVVSCLRYWLASYTSSGAYEALQGFVKGCAAIAMLLIFVPAFDGLSRATNMFTAALISGPVQPTTGHGIAHALSMDAVANGGMGMMITIASIVMALVLLVVKVVVLVLLAVLYVASPLAIAIWPVEELAWPLRTLLQTMVALLIFPIVWALCFGVMSVLPVDALFPSGTTDSINSMLAPLVLLAAMIVAFKVPFAMLKQSMSAGMMPSVNRGLGTVRNIGYARKGVRQMMGG